MTAWRCRRRPSPDRRGRRAGPARRRQRGRRRGRGGDDVVRDREPAHRPRRGRLHARPRGRRDRRARLLRRGARAPSASSAARSSSRSRSGSRPTRSRSSTSAPPPAAFPGRPRGWSAPPSASGPCRWPSSRRRRPGWRATGSMVNGEQAYFFAILAPILTDYEEARELYAPGGNLLGEGDLFRFPDLGDALERFGAEGAEPFYTRRDRGGDLRLGAGARRDARARRPRRLRADPPRAGRGAASAGARCSRTRRPPRAAS